MLRGAQVRRARTLEVVRLDRAPRFTHLPAHGVQIERAVAPQRIVRLFGRRLEKGAECCRELRRRLERAQPECVDQHQPGQPIAVIDRKPRCDRASQNLADQRRLRFAGLVDQRGEPGRDAIRVCILDAARRAMSGKVGRDYMVCGCEVRDHPQPLGCVLSGTVQEHDCRSSRAARSRAASPRR